LKILQKLQNAKLVHLNSLCAWGEIKSIQGQGSGEVAAKVITLFSVEISTHACKSLVFLLIRGGIISGAGLEEI
jgi:hypothetical protein